MQLINFKVLVTACVPPVAQQSDVHAWKPEESAPVVAITVIHVKTKDEICFDGALLIYLFYFFFIFLICDVSSFCFVILHKINGKHVWTCFVYVYCNLLWTIQENLDFVDIIGKSTSAATYKFIILLMYNINLYKIYKFIVKANVRDGFSFWSCFKFYFSNL